MPKYGIQYSSTDALKKADGRSHDAGTRAFANHFDLTVDGGTNQSLKIADLPPGVVVKELMVESDQNLSAINFTAGTLTTVAKYAASGAGPNATAKTFYAPLALKLDATADAEELYLFPSANLPSAGSLRVTVYGTKR
jgi:hypothetical protein